MTTFKDFALQELEKSHSQHYRSYDQFRAYFETGGGTIPFKDMANIYEAYQSEPLQKEDGKHGSRCPVCQGLLFGELGNEDDFWCLGHSCIVNDEKGKRVEFTPDSQPDNREGLINILRMVKNELNGWNAFDLKQTSQSIVSVLTLVSAALEQIDNRKTKNNE